MKKIFLYILVFVSIITNAQDYNEVEEYFNAYDYDEIENDYEETRHVCERTKPYGWNDTLMLLPNFIPRNDTFPVITIKCNVHIWREDDGTGNRWLDTDEYRDSLRMVFDYANYIMTNNIEYSEIIPDAEFISDTKYRLVLDSVFYYNDSVLAYKTSNNALNQFIRNNYPERLDNFAVHMNLAYRGQIAGYSSGISSLLQSVILINCKVGRYTGLWATAQLLIHEIGHNLGLDHPYNTEENNITHPEFLWDMFGKTQQPWCDEPDTNEVCYHDWGWDCEVSDTTNTCTNNIMGGSKYGGHYTALQCGRIHRALRVANIRKHAYGYTNIPLVINKNQLWDFTYKSYQDIVIEENTTLTVSCRLEMVSQSKIIIKPGGRLIVDGGTITNAHHEGKWQGIEVWGNDSVPQYPYDGVYSQGFLELKNGATIENAVCAVELWNPLDNHSEGGIVHATDAIFRNNAKAIHALNYTNYDPEMIFEIDYNSSFNNCSFVVDSNYMGEELFQRHIDLSNVSGFNLHGCSFSVDKSVPQVTPRPYGIVANNTGLNLSYYIPEDELLLPGGNFTRNSFEGFETGIYVTNSSQYSRTVSVEYSDFSNNAKGLLVQNTGYATINNNNFIIGYDADCSFGLYLDRVSYFDVEENTFIGNANYGSDNYGVMVRSSASYNDISRNTFRNLQCGNVSLGKNYVTGSRVGLTYTCNTNIGNVNDFCIFKEDGIGGISSCQGSLVDPAGNTFSGSNYHICNDGDNTISYYYQSNNNLQRPVASKLYNVRAVGSSNISSCGIGNIPVIDIMSIDDVVTLENVYNTTLAAYNALLQTNSQSVETAEDIEAQLSQLKTEYLNTVGEIVKFYLQQEEKDYEELREWLVKSEDIFADRMVVASFIQEGNYDDAMTYATMLPKIHNLKGEELQDHNDYMKLIDLYIDLHEADRTANQLTDAELTMVKNISDNGIGTSQMMAESILLAIGEPSLRVPQCLTMPPALIILPQTRGAEQEIEFASVGTKWYYDYNEDMTGWDNGYVLIESVIDTLIDDMSCRKLVKTIYEYNQDSNEEQQRVIGYEYVSQIDDSVMIYRDGEFKKLYDFGAEVGDTLIIPGHDYDPALMNGQGVVVDKGTIEFDGQTLRYIDLKHPKDTPWQFPIFVSYGEDYYTVRICEKIGNISGYLLPEPYNTGVEVLWEGGGALRCYSDNVMSVSFQDKACDYIVSVDGISSQGLINIFPNPANDNITIELTADCHTIEIYDSFGRMMMSQQVTESLSHQVVDIDISKYPSGLYLVVVKDDNNRYYKRIVKN